MHALMKLHPMLRNGWIGKVVLTSLALALAPERPAYAALVITLGFALGYEWDLLMTNRVRHGGRAASRRAQLSAAEQGSPWTVFLICGLGRIASAGGAVEKGHVALAEQLFTELDLDADERQRAIRWFNAGKTAECPFSELADLCSQRPDPRAEANVLSGFSSQVQVVDRAAALTAMQDLTRLLRYRGIRAETDSRAAPGSRSGAASEALSAAAVPADSAAAWAFFDLVPDSDAAEIKLAYRRFVSRFHPDRLPMNATDSERALAQRRMIEARVAYEELLHRAGDRG
ncbi:MAG: hypothetical protein AAF918_03590 [Pseudomonadota bacterium]